MKDKFFIEREDGSRHLFMSEKYARGYLKATYREILFKCEKEPNRYELQDYSWTENEFRISVKDKSRLYFLNKKENTKFLSFSGRLGKQIMANIS